MTIEFDGQNNKLGTTTANSVTIKTNDTDALTVDSSQNVGIGTSSPSSPLTVSTTSSTVAKIVCTEDGTSASRITFYKDSSSPADGDGIGLIDFNANDSGDTEILFGRIGVFAEDVTAGTTDGSMRFYTRGNNSNTERMRIDSSGRVGIGTSSPEASSIISTKGASDGLHHHYFFNASGVGVGRITCTASTTSYVTSSDYRLKENVVDITGATDRLKQLQPKRFNFIADADTTVDGFLAHEVSDIIPEAISGTKDEVDADGNPVYQGIDQSKLVPLLTASLKEAIAKIEELETRLEALENE